MADASAKFAVQLEDETSGAANAAAGALDKLERQITRDQKALKALEASFRMSKKAAFDSSVDYIGMAKAIQDKAGVIASTSRDFLALGGSFGQAARRGQRVRDLAKEMAGDLVKLREANAARRASFIASMADDLRGLKDRSKAVANDNAKPTSPFNPKLWAMAAARQQTFARATEATKIAVTKLTPAARAAAPKLADFKDALEGGGGKLPPFVKDLIEGTQALGPLGIAISAVAASLLGLGIAAGALFKLGGMALAAQEELEGVSQAAINVAKRSPIARTEIAKLSAELEKTGLKGAALEQALEKKVAEKYGKDATRSMRSLSVQIAKAKENLSLLFTGVKTAPMLAAAEKLFRFLDDSTIEGKALKALLETLLNPVFEGLARAGPAAKQFFQGMIIGALMVAIAILKVKKRLEDVIGLKLDLGAIDWTKLGIAVMFAAAALAVVVGAIGLVVGLILASVAVVGLLAFAFGTLVVQGAKAVAALPAAIGSLLNFLVSRVSAMADAGRQFAAGLAEGIRSGLSEVVNAALSLATGAVDAIKNKLKMRSPSKLGQDIGGNFGGSIAMGAESETGTVQAAAIGLGEALVPPQRGSAAAAPGGGQTITIEQVNVYGVDGADDPAFVAKVTEAFQQALALAGVS